MAVLKTIKRNRRSESLRGRFMVDTVRGVLRIRKWPRKRGTPKSESQLWWIDWFRQANKLAKYVDAASMRRAIELTAGTGKYPRDILLQAMRGRLYVWQDENGKTWYPMAAVQDISESLDVIAQTVGNVLVRATDRWRRAGPETPAIGHVLTYQGTTAPPIWAGAGGGIQQIDLPGTPFTPDGTVAQYIFAVTPYVEVAIILDAITLSASQQIFMRASIDGGDTYKSGGSDYAYLFTSGSWDASGPFSTFHITGGNAASQIRAVAILTGIQTARALCIAHGADGVAAADVLSGFTSFNGPITHIKIWTATGALFTGGTFALMGKTA
jgi:hypothetical protein